MKDRIVNFNLNVNRGFQFNLTCWLVLLISLFAKAQEKNDQFIKTYISTEQGLSNNYVSSIISDEFNIKWIGTENGINKYNGNDFDYIQPSKSKGELRNENIEVLFRDKNNNIWIGTKSGGISYLNLTNNKLSNFNFLIGENIRVTTIAQDTTGAIWVGTWRNGIFVIHKSLKKIEKHIKTFNPTLQIIKGKGGDMWYFHGRNLIKFNTIHNTRKEFKLEAQITDLIYDTYRNRIWISPGKNETRLFYYDYENKVISSIKTEIKSNFSKILSLDKDNRLWIGTWGYGLYRSNQDLTSFDNIELHPDGSERIRRNYDVILSIHHDQNDQIWVGTANTGIVKLVAGKKFNSAANLISDDVTNGDMNIQSILRTKEQLFVGTLKSGLLMGTDFKNLKHLKEAGSQKIFSLYRYKNKLFVGAETGFLIYDLQTQNFILNNTSIQKVTGFFVDEDESLYIGTQQQGLFQVELDNLKNPDSYIQYAKGKERPFAIASNRITEIKQGINGNIWVSTYNGLHVRQKNSKIFLNLSQILSEPLPSVIINTLALKGKKIYLGTPSGLAILKFDNSIRDIKMVYILNKNKGLNNDFICSLTFDHDDDLWIATNTEIVKFNEADKSFLTYGDFQGVKTMAFNKRAVYNYRNKTIYFGGIDNITYFDPELISEFDPVPEVFFSNLRVQNNSVTYDPSSETLDKALSYANKITLDYQDRFFTLGFAVNDFLGPLNLRYRYRLKGLNEDWVDLQNKNKINFAGIPPGTYRLDVEATRDNQNWSKPESITIQINPSLWLSWWSILAYVLIFGLGAYFFVKFKKKQYKLKNNLEVLKIEKEKEHALSEAKFKFFTNISHELRTPLTLILGPLQELTTRKNLPEEVYQKLNFIEKNASKLLNLINQLLDFRKADHGSLKISPSYGNFISFSNEIFLYFKEIASEKKIKYKFCPASAEIRFPFDRNKIEIVLCNLLSNAFKYCNAGNKIKVKLYEEKNYCYIIVKDTGIGMDAKDVDKIFDHFFQIKSANTSKMTGSGIGLAFSKKIIELHHGSISVKSAKNKGTKVTVKIPMDRSLYEDVIDEEDMIADNNNAYPKYNQNSLEHNLNIHVKKNIILVIDDNPDILYYLKDILTNDYHIQLAKDGQAGYEIASKTIPDLIVSDVMMPKKDGITLCKELKSQIHTSHIPIILLTARSSTAFEIEGLKTGADDYVSKPFNPSVIKARIASLLSNRAKLREYMLNKVRFEPTSKELNLDTPTEDAFIQKAILLVEENLQNPDFGIETMIEGLHMSQSTLYRKIKSLTGLSTTAFIRSVRLKKAAMLIMTEDKNLKEIAYEVGFNDYKYFKTSFKKQYTCLPSKYKGEINALYS